MGLLFRAFLVPWVMVQVLLESLFQGATHEKPDETYKAV